MSDPINGVSNPAGNIPTGNKAKPSQESAATPAPASPTTESSAVVNLTETAETLQILQKQLADAPAVDQQKIDSIKQALLEGKYQVDADKVAEKFIEIEKALGKV